jgi:hypothetical protein
MALEECRFFTGEMSDGRYNADGYAEYLRSIVTDGVFSLGTNLQVAAAEGMAVSVNYGKAVLRGYRYYLKDNDSGVMKISLDAANIQPRIDRIVIRQSITDKSVKFAVLKGSPAETPATPALTNTADVFEISLAKINIAANATVLTSGNITDERTLARIISPDGTKYVEAPENNTDGYIPRWDGENSKKLKNGLIFSNDGTLAENRDNAIVSEQAIRTFANTKLSISGGTLDGPLTLPSIPDGYPLIFANASGIRFDRFGNVRSKDSPGASAVWCVIDLNGTTRFSVPIGASNPVKIDSNEVWHNGNTPKTSGNWQPSLQGDSVQGSFTYGTRTGNYERIGNIVMFYCKISITNIGTAPTGNFYIIGLPYIPAHWQCATAIFVASGTANANIATISGVSTSPTYPGFIIRYLNSSRVNTTMGSGNSGLATGANTFNVEFGGFYRTTEAA